MPNLYGIDVTYEDLKVLCEARQLILDKSCWTIGVMARNKYRHQVSPVSDAACKWCALGAIFHAYGEDVKPWSVHKMSRFYWICGAYKVFRDVSEYGITYTNDYLGHDATILRFDDAIRATETALEIGWGARIA